MPLACGIVGLPNAGKSTLFNALTRAGAPVASYPFCTVDRNIGTTVVPDERLALVQRFAGSAQATPTAIKMVDIAGLVQGASRGEGLGNKFLGHIRDVDAILHVVRCFRNETAPHYVGDVDPRRDVDLIVTELILADLATIERRRERIFTAARTGDVAARAELNGLDQLTKVLDDGIEARRAGLARAVIAQAEELRLLTLKPVVLVGNVSDPDDSYTPQASGTVTSGKSPAEATLEQLAQERGDAFVAIYARALADVAELGEEGIALAAELGICPEPLNQLVREAYKTLDLITFFTANRTEARAWTLQRGSDAVAAAGKVHSDFARGFIATEVIAADVYAVVANHGEAQRAGTLRLEGRGYQIEDGDLLEFRVSV